MNPALIACLLARPQARTIIDVADWWRVWQSLNTAGAGPAALAIAGGFAADRVGWAFASGYQAALRTLLPDLPRDTLAAFCVTETTVTARETFARRSRRSPMVRCASMAPSAGPHWARPVRCC